MDWLWPCNQLMMRVDTNLTSHFSARLAVGVVDDENRVVGSNCAQRNGGHDGLAIGTSHRTVLHSGAVEWGAS